MQKARPTVTITVPEVNAFHLGLLISLFERAVGLYAAMTGVNAYNQPGVEAGKLSAGQALLCLDMAVEFLHNRKGERFAAVEIAEQIGRKDDAFTIFVMLRHAAYNDDKPVKMAGIRQKTPSSDLLRPTRQDSETAPQRAVSLCSHQSASRHYHALGLLLQVIRFPGGGPVLALAPT